MSDPGDDFDDEPHAPNIPIRDRELVNGRQVFSILTTADNTVSIRSDEGDELADFPMYEFGTGRYVLVKLPDEVDDEAPTESMTKRHSLDDLPEDCPHCHGTVHHSVESLMDGPTTVGWECPHCGASDEWPLSEEGA